jgi:hypothetical protein
VAAPLVYQRGPNAARDKETALRLLKILEDHRWIKRVDGGAEADRVACCTRTSATRSNLL